MANLLYGSENFSTTLNVGGGINNSQTTGIILTSVSGLNTNGGMLGFTWASTIDSTTYEEIEYGGISGNELTGVVRGSGGTSAKSHLNGATVVAIVSKEHNNRLADKLRSVDATLSADPNGNEIVKTAYVASAVNEITVTNAATGNNPTVEGTGGDSTVPVHYKGKSAFNKHSGEYDNGNSGASKTINWNNGDRQKVTITAATTLSYSNATAGQTLTLRVVEDGTGGWSVTLPTSKWPGGIAGSFTTTASAINLLIVYYDGTNYLTQLASGFS